MLKLLYSCHYKRTAYFVVLFSYLQEIFKFRLYTLFKANDYINEFKNLEKWEEILLIPLGKAVEEVLIKLKEDGIVKEEQVLMGFPHPSGANVNRVAQFEANRDNMIKFIKKHFI